MARFLNTSATNYFLEELIETAKGKEAGGEFRMSPKFGADFLWPAMPENVMTAGYTSYIKSKQKVLFSDDDVRSIVSAIQSGALPKTWATRTAHVESLKARHSSTTTCPKCSSDLVLRTAKSGANAGKQFYGCSRFPACRYMRNV